LDGNDKNEGNEEQAISTAIKNLSNKKQTEKDKKNKIKKNSKMKYLKKN
jgi:hypothetical protein